MFLFAREVARRTAPALVAALAYALSFHRLHIILYQGDLQVAVVFVIFPLVLWSYEHFLRTRAHARRTFVLVSLALAAMILNHQGYAFFGLVFIAIYLATRLLSMPSPVRQRIMLLLFVAGTQLAALLMSALLIVPFLFDVDDIRGMQNTTFSILIPNPRAPLLLLKLFRWSAMSDGTSVGYIGLSVGVMAILGGAYAVRRRIGPAVALAAGAAASLFMVRSGVQYNVKNIDFLMIFLAALTAWAPSAIEQWTPRIAALARSQRRWASLFTARISLALIALLLLDLGPTTFQSVYREDYDFKQGLYERLAASGEGYKVIERQVRRYEPGQPPSAGFEPTRLGVPSAHVLLQSPVGFFHEGAGKSFGYNVEMVKRVHRDLNEGRLSDESLDVLHLMGVKRILFRDRYRWFTPPVEPSPDYTVEEGVLTLAGTSPLVASTRVITVDEVAGYDRDNIIEARRYLEPETYDPSGRYFRELVLPLLRTMRLNRSHSTADVLIAQDAAIRTTSDEIAPVQLSVERFSSDIRRVDVAYESDRASVGRLAYTFYPYLDVRVDGAPVEFYRSAMNEILLRLPPGRHQITVTGVAPPMQAQMAWVSLFALIAVMALPGRIFSQLETSANA
jgi:hypothetical protein